MISIRGLLMQPFLHLHRLSKCYPIMAAITILETLFLLFALFLYLLYQVAIGHYTVSYRHKTRIWKEK